MRNSDWDGDDAPDRPGGASLSPEEFRERSPKDPQAEAERARQVMELVSALRNFAQHFGAEEIYQQARAIYAETAEGRTAIEREAAQIVQRGNAQREDGSSSPERPRRPSSDRPPRNEPRGVAEARRMLGG